MKIKFLLKKKAEITQAMKDLLALAQSEDRALNEDEMKDFEAKQAEKDRLEKQIKAIESAGLDEEETENKTSVSSAPASTGNHIPGPRGKKEFDSVEEFVGSVIDGARDPRLADLYVEPRSEQRMDTGAKGGFMIPAQFRPQILSVDPAASIVRARATVIPAGSPPDAEIIIPALDQRVSGGEPQVFGGVAVGKVSEGGTKPSTDANLREVKLKPEEMAARIPFTDKLLRNWQAAQSWATNLLRGALTAFEDYQFCLGNGVGGPLGIVRSAAAVLVNRAVSLQIALADIKKMYARFSGNQATGVWLVSFSAFEQLLSIVGDGGGATNIISVNQGTGAITIYGMPVIRHPRLSALGAKGDLILTDFKDYLIKDGSGPIVEVGYATGQWETNKRSIKITWNVDGRSWLTEPFQDEEEFPKSSIVVLDLPSGS